ncbi:hypothetical protein [Streptomyces sp. H39-S7]|uniref:hypothetical protein n=1 Tax=Streptomyces sp. H39-S7 TaxID=3004357 RepID=UPI0022B00FA0|nr:hypothetical protein [Streptomyces sp. H39-S7]MCZ4125053.1 hypothetical protein [Streptomyces sp. H39-S7]
MSECHEHPEPNLYVHRVPLGRLRDSPQACKGGVTLNLYDQLSAYVPERPGAYLRISSDRFGLEAGVDRQSEDTDDTRRHLRWGQFAKFYKENDTSAFKKRKVVREDGTIDWIVIVPSSDSSWPTSPAASSTA